MPSFPVRIPVPTYDSAKDSPRHFGAGRKTKMGGFRAHAACDLWAPVGTPIFAIADGTILRFEAFYEDTYALEVHHPGIGVVRYGEVMGPARYAKYQASLMQQFRKSGVNVSGPIEMPSVARRSVHEGELIAAVGQLIHQKGNLRGRNYNHTMLHFELYAESAKGQPLTDRSGKTKFFRNGALRDPTKLLLSLQRSPHASADRAESSMSSKRDTAGVKPTSQAEPNPTRKTRPRVGDWNGDSATSARKRGDAVFDRH